MSLIHRPIIRHLTVFLFFLFITPVHADTRLIDNNSTVSVENMSKRAGLHTSSVVINSQLAVGYYDGTNTAVKLWWDDGNGGGTAGNGLADGAEIRTIDDSASVGLYTSMTVINSQLAISYFDDTNDDLKLWWDNGNGGGIAGDGIAQVNEIRVLDSVGSVGIYSSITAINNQLAVSYYDNSSFDLKLWWDDGNGLGTAGDGIAQADEIRTLDSGGNVGIHTSITVINNQLAVSYYDSSNFNVKLWWDDGKGPLDGMGNPTGIAGNGIADGDEIRTIQSAGSIGLHTSITVLNNQLAVSYYDAGIFDLRLWWDNGNGGGIAGDGVAHADEIRALDSPGSVGRYGSITSINNQLAVSYYDDTNDDLKLWVDDGSGGGSAGDGIAQAGEFRTLDSLGDVGLYTSITVMNNQLVVSYYDKTNDDLKLWFDDGNGGGTAGNGDSEGSELRKIDASGNVGLDASAVLINSKLAVSYYDVTNDDLKLWWDDGNGGGTAGNGVADGSELRTIDSTGSVGSFTSITQLNNRIAVSYYDGTNQDLKLWWDNGNGGGTAGDGIAHVDEIRTLDSVGNVGTYTSITVINNQLAVSYYDDTTDDLKLWWDDGNGGGTASDGVAQFDEIRIIDSAGTVGWYTSIVVFNNRLAISYYDPINTELKLWLDDGNGGGTANDGASHPDEIRTIASMNSVGSFCSLTVLNGQLAISYHDSTNDDLKFWWDDGNGSGTATDVVAQADEIRTIDSTDNVGTFTSIAVVGGRLAVSYYDVTNSNLKVWHDNGKGGGTAGNGVADGGEISNIDSNGDAGQYTSILNANGVPVVSYYNNSEGALYIGSSGDLSSALSPSESCYVIKSAGGQTITFCL